MRLKNKKTGKVHEITQAVFLSDDMNKKFAIYSQSEGHNYAYGNLAELNAEWEDYRESKTYWYIYGNQVLNNECDGVMENWFKEIGNYFETKEEAEKELEKIKAYKRLKDKGAKIIDYECYGGTNKKGEFSGEVKVTIGIPQEVDKYLFKLLFGGDNEQD